MAYFVEHVRFTLECDACGRVEKRDLDNPEQRADFERDGMDGWGEIRTSRQSCFCCPACVQSVTAVLGKRDRERQAAKDLAEAQCAHDYQQRGLLVQCTKCKRFRVEVQPQTGLLASPPEPSKG